MNPAPCSFGLSATSQQYFSLRTNQHQPSATSQTNRLSHRKFLDIFIIPDGLNRSEQTLSLFDYCGLAQVF
jgi:hypothetical protein